MPDTGILVREERRYWLKAKPDKPLPRGIEGPLELLATRSYRIDSMTTAPMSGQVRANALKVTIDLPEPQGIVARPIGYAGPGIRLLTSEAKWDFASNLVQVGGGYIEVLSTELRSFGIGALFMNMAIGWAQAFHQDADAHQLSVQPDKYEEDRKRFYRRFGYSFSGKTNSAGNQLSDPTTIARIHLADHPSIESDANLKRKA